VNHQTLDEYLAEVDKWKDEVSTRSLSLSSEERQEMGKKARNRLEARLGRKLECREAPKIRRRSLHKVQKTS
jgi:hypothetical protein